MNRPYRLSANSITSYLNCREQFRRTYVEGIEQKRPAVHLELGAALHEGIDRFWKGKGYDQAVSAVGNRLRSVDLTEATTQDRQKWEDFLDTYPDMLEAYFSFHKESEIEQVLASEYEWETPLSENSPPGGVVLNGRLDRVMTDGVHVALIDTKTRSSYGDGPGQRHTAWIRSAREEYARNFGLGLYDWHMRCMDPNGKEPDIIRVELIVKPYRSQKTRIEMVDLPEIIAGRDRFDQQLKVIVAEIEYWLDNYQDMKPWPMSPGAICTRYDGCPFKDICLYGESPKIMQGYQERRQSRQQEVQ